MLVKAAAEPGALVGGKLSVQKLESIFTGLLQAKDALLSKLTTKASVAKVQAFSLHSVRFPLLEAVLRSRHPGVSLSGQGSLLQANGALLSKLTTKASVAKVGYSG